MNTKILKKGDKVVMHTCMESKGKNFGKIWTCRTDSFKNDAGDEVVFLDGFSGSFDTEFLQPVSLPESGEGWISVEERLPTEKDGYAENIYFGLGEDGNPRYFRCIHVIAHFARTGLDPEEVRETRIILDPPRTNKRITHWMPMPTFNGRWI